MTREELLDDEEYADICDDVTCELEAKYGALASVLIPQPSRVGPGMDPPGVGLVFVQFASLGNAVGRDPASVLGMQATVHCPVSSLQRDCRIGPPPLCMVHLHAWWPLVWRAEGV